MKISKELAKGSTGLPDCDLIWLVTVPRPFLVTLVLLLTAPEELD